MRRFPLWLTIVPLVIGGGVYWHFWSGWRDQLRTDLAVVMPGTAVAIGGFPYRLEADVAAPAYALRGPAALTLAGDGARINRTPWQRALTVVRVARPHAAAAVAGVGVAVDAASAASSVHLTARGIARLSTVFTTAAMTTSLATGRIAATTLEVHLRETRARSNEAWSATPPQQAEVVVAGTGVRIRQSAPLTLDLAASVTASSPLRSVAGWADGGTVEVRAATLADASGEVARLVASIVPAGATLRLGGTVTTVCPATVRAMVDGTPAPREPRLRNPVRLAFGGTPGFFVLAPLAAGAPTAIRGQLPPCPRLS